MFKSKIFLTLTSLIPVSFLPVIISCQQNEKEITFAVNKPWYGDTKADFFNKVIENFNSSIDNDKDKLELKKVNYLLENIDTANNLIKGASNIATLTSLMFNQNSSNLVPIVQTMTKAFKFDKDINVYYKNGLQEDGLRKIANKVQEMFDIKPYIEWNNEQMQWNGSIYQYFYDENNELVDFYRGIIMLQGNQETIDQIKKAWDEKDWNTFRNFGIVIGKQDSASKYILPELLFKKHFNLANNKFNGFKLDQIENSSKYITGKPRDIGRGALSKFHIVFDDLGSFAYTKNYRKQGDQIIINNYYTPEDKDAKIHFLTATEPMKYNVFATLKSFNQNSRIKLANSIVNVWRNGQDDYGYRVGFNGYKVIQNPDEEVIKPYLKLFEIN
ncbi:alkylphosphonate ABC transporter substrate-binidng protein [[Mycoplasma] falconis]|uniref:Alkylphosphonate ABC transporter substrate-binidng protein n=1 Tax=[Mycoplasma] falconis TaxID=92403 RepID=A0A501X9J0_9BACT|nr:alkylphosphonate ABC transporter substrate-binidng protein [[Mycoplasma] falconis]TPE57192.1 alkylphosphonate ABC transporter substrate-binidng protein [[Mycoplasma] falconis]